MKMMFLLRTAFWTCVALALLPSFAPTPSSTVPVDLSASEAVTAASATVADVSSFCDRRPQACAAGAEIFSAFGQRVQAGAHRRAIERGRTPTTAIDGGRSQAFAAHAYLRRYGAGVARPVAASG